MYTRVVAAEDDQVQESAPIDKASPWSLITYRWLNPLLAIGAQRPLDFPDLPPLSREDTCDTSAAKLAAAWEREKVRGSGSESYWPLVRAIAAVVGREYACVGLTYLLSVLLGLAQPMLISQLVEWVGDEEGTVLQGLLLAAGIAGTLLLAAAAEQWTYFWFNRAEMRVRGALMVLVYEKALRVSGVRQGNASNLLNVDPPKVAYMTWHVHRAWVYPIQVVLTLYLLWRWLGTGKCHF